jgi:hypothetical protein
MSAATWIMAGCDERYVTPNTQIMLHKWRGGIYGETETDIKIEMKQYSGWLTSVLNQIYADNSRMPVEFWEEITKRDLFITAEETIKLGLADAIIQPKKRGNLRRKRIAQMNKPVDKKEMRRLVSSLNTRIERGKNLKIELHVPEEEFDKNVYVEEVSSQHSEEQESQAPETSQH